MSYVAILGKSAAVAGTHGGGLRRASRFRTTVESSETAGYPIVPVGDAIKANVTEQTDELGNPMRTIGYPVIGWQISHRAGLGNKLPSSKILDVYTALLFLYKNAGMPEDGVVYFSRYQLLLLLGWLSSSTDESGRKRTLPAGRHYAQLKLAVKYLEHTRFSNDNPRLAQVGPDGAVFHGYQGFPILQYARLVEDPTGPRTEHGPVQPRSMVQFSTPFVKMLQRGVTSMDLDLFLSLPSGTPRHLLRLFSWMREEGVTALPISDVFQRVGSTQTEFVPARARQILGKAHADLRARGVLSAEPEYRKGEDGRWFIQYAFGDAEELLSEEEMLVGQAMAYGVAVTTARELAVAQRTQLERILAAATLGIVRPKRTLASMIVHYARRGFDAFDQCAWAAADAQLSIELGTIETEYLAWAAAERQARLTERPDIDAARIRAAIKAQNAGRTTPRPDWVIEGLVAIRLNDLLGIETLDEFREARNRIVEDAAA